MADIADQAVHFITSQSATPLPAPVAAGPSGRSPGFPQSRPVIARPSIFEKAVIMIPQLLFRSLPMSRARVLSPLAAVFAVAMAIMFMLAGSAPAMAAADAVQIMLIQQKVVKDEDGKELKINADSVLPGDIVEYRAVYRNVSKAPVSGLLADLPIPEGLAYVDKSATPGAGLKATAAKAPVSTSFAALPLMRAGADGKMVRLPLSDYRMLRWTVGKLAPGAEFVVSARVRVIAPAPIPAAARKNAPQAPPVGTGARP